MSEFNITEDGWLQNQDLSVRHIKSANYNQRPDENDICLVVVHNISLPPNQFGGDYIEQFFCNQLNPQEHDYFMEIKDLKVSAHVLIKRCGSIVQFVPFKKRAWHAGVSTWNNRSDCNDYSIGIELEGADHIEYERIQYDVLNQLIAILKTTYKHIGTNAVVGHNDIAPGRKTDPGKAFDWSKID